MRKKCKELYNNHCSVIEISKELCRSRNWVYKWIERSSRNDEFWYLSDSTEPNFKPHKTDGAIESAVVESRKYLERRDTPETKYSFYGAIGIHQDLNRQKIEEKPSIPTINRILKRHGLTKNGASHHDRNKPKIYYPAVHVRHPGFLHQMDMITPLYISGYGKVISVNRIDVFNSHARIRQYDAKNADNILEFLIEDWMLHGIPRYLQVDNDAAFRGSIYHPRSIGKMVRFCLNFDVQVIFIPFNEPWRNGHIESLNGRFQDLVWNRHPIKNLSHLRKESVHFTEKHNDYQSYRKNLTIAHWTEGHITNFLPHNFVFNNNLTLPITTGLIHYVRQIKENGNVSINNEDFYVDSKLSYEYLWCVLNTKEQTLSFFHKATKESAKTLVKKCTYILREIIKNRIPLESFLM